jgi:hypothetical protein
MTVYELIRQAIIDKKIVRATYRRHERLMCPHTIGESQGRKKALFYQFAGGSSSGLAPDGEPDNWRCVFVAELTNVFIEEGEWHTCPIHTKRQTCIRNVDTEVAY